MDKNILFNKNEIVLSKGSLGFKKILDDFKVSNEINIITYSLKKEDKLLEYLKELEEYKTINIVSNMPHIYDSYDTQNDSDKAKEVIDYYLEISNQCYYLFRWYNLNVNFYVNFNNNCKIVSTENMCYIGSQNYETVYDNNFECGQIIYDKKVIEEVNSKFVKKIIKDSRLFDDYDFIQKLYKNLENINL